MIFKNIHLGPVQSCVYILPTFKVCCRPHPSGKQAKGALVQARLEQFVIWVVPRHIGHAEMALNGGVKQLSVLQIPEQLYHVLAPLSGSLREFVCIRGVGLLQIVSGECVRKAISRNFCSNKQHCYVINLHCSVIKKAIDKKMQLQNAIAFLYYIFYYIFLFHTIRLICFVLNLSHSFLASS